MVVLESLNHTPKHVLFIIKVARKLNPDRLLDQSSDTKFCETNPFLVLWRQIHFDRQWCQGIFSTTDPLQSFQFVNGFIQLPLDRGFIATQDLPTS